MRMFHILIQRGDSLGSFTTAIELYPAYSVHCTERRGWGNACISAAQKTIKAQTGGVSLLLAPSFGPKFWPQVALKSRAPTESACFLACASSQTSNDFDFGSAWRGNVIWSREATLKPITSRYGFLSMFIALIQSCVYRVRIDLPERCVSWGDCTTKVQLYDSYTIREDNGPFFATNLTVNVLLFHSFLGTFCGRRAPCANRGGDSDRASLY